MGAGWIVTAYDGIGGRKEQQDRVRVLRPADGNGVLVALADGMGGHMHGARAAEIMVETAARWASVRQLSLNPDRCVEKIFAEANTLINHAANALASDLGTTAVVAWLDEAIVVCGHVGDSRAYFFRSGNLVHRTRDDSVVQILVDTGEIADADMATHPERDVLLRCVSGSASCVPTMTSFPADRVDAVLMCSDGLWESVGLNELTEAVAAKDLTDAARKLIQTACERGGETGDNVSIALARRSGSSVR
jgi:serine/threonine protein phosphatase PrpC